MRDTGARLKRSRRLCPLRNNELFRSAKALLCLPICQSTTQGSPPIRPCGRYCTITMKISRPATARIARNSMASSARWSMRWSRNTYDAETCTRDLPGFAAPTLSAKMSTFWRFPVKAAGFARVVIQRKRFSSERTSPITSSIPSRIDSLYSVSPSCCAYISNTTASC